MVPFRASAHRCPPPVPAVSTTRFSAGDGNIPSANCLNGIESVLQTDTGMQQDIVEGNFQGTLFKGWAGDVSSALGFQYRRDAGQFTPDTLQSTNSFLDEPVGLYPLGTLMEEEFTAREGYAEFWCRWFPT